VKVKRFTKRVASAKVGGGVAEEVAKIRRKLGHLSLDRAPTTWLDLGSASLNRVLGNAERGVPYGRIVEVSGLESHGKTALTLTLAALAQQDGALVIWADFENSYTPEWAAVRGLDPEQVALVSPYVGRFGKEKDVRLPAAQELCEEVEALIVGFHGRYKKIFLAGDSITSMLTEGEASAGLGGQNMRTRMDLPMFLGALMRRWVGMAQAHNVLMVFVNQLRQKPGMAFGDPWYTPGGNAVRFYSHVRVRVRRTGAKGGRITVSGHQTGIQGIVTNKKNKVGGLESSEIGYRLLFDGPMKFVPAREVRKKAAGEEEE
jgi:recombination protein RecA